MTKEIKCDGCGDTGVTTTGEFDDIRTVPCICTLSDGSDEYDNLKQDGGL